MGLGPRMYLAAQRKATKRAVRVAKAAKATGRARKLSARAAANRAVAKKHITLAALGL